MPSGLGADFDEIAKQLAKALKKRNELSSTLVSHATDIIEILTERAMAGEKVHIAGAADALKRIADSLLTEKKPPIDEIEDALRELSEKLKIRSAAREGEIQKITHEASSPNFNDEKEDIYKFYNDIYRSVQKNGRPIDTTVSIGGVEIDMRVTGEYDQQQLMSACISHYMAKTRSNLGGTKKSTLSQEFKKLKVNDKDREAGV